VNIKAIKLLIVKISVTMAFTIRYALGKLKAESQPADVTHDAPLKF